MHLNKKGKTFTVFKLKDLPLFKAVFRYLWLKDFGNVIKCHNYFAKLQSRISVV